MAACLPDLEFVCRNWGSSPDDDQTLARAPSVDLSLPALGKPKPAKAAFPYLTKLLVSALVILFVFQVGALWPHMSFMNTIRDPLNLQACVKWHHVSNNMGSCPDPLACGGRLS